MSNGVSWKITRGSVLWAPFDTQAFWTACISTNHVIFLSGKNLPEATQPPSGQSCYYTHSPGSFPVHQLYLLLVGWNKRLHFLDLGLGKAC